MPVLAWESNYQLWVQSGRSAANAGRTGQALEATVVLLGQLCGAARIITENQQEVNRAINQLSARPRR